MTLNGARCAICSTAARRTIISSPRSKTTARRACASATAIAAPRPPALSVFDATYRVGNGAAGNVGAEAIAHLFSADSGLRGAVKRCAIPCPPRRRRSGNHRAGARSTRRRRFALRSARSPKPTTPRWPSAIPACSARRRPCAGPAAGTRSSSPSTGSAALPVDSDFEDDHAQARRTLPHGGARSRDRRSALCLAGNRHARLRRAGLFPRRCESVNCSTLFSNRDVDRRPARFISSGQFHLRTDGLFQSADRRGAARRGRDVGAGH